MKDERAESAIAHVHAIQTEHAQMDIQAQRPVGSLYCGDRTGVRVCN